MDGKFVVVNLILCVKILNHDACTYLQFLSTYTGKSLSEAFLFVVLGATV